jgi:hypothetical protein
MLKTRSIWWTLCAIVATSVMLPPVQLAHSVAPAPATVLEAAPETTLAEASRHLPSISAPQPETASLYSVEYAVQQARAGGAGEDEVYRIRAGALSAQTIGSLTEREQAEQLWKQRLQAWRAARAMLNPADSIAQQALRDRLFDAEEQAQVDAAEPAHFPRLILP